MFVTCFDWKREGKLSVFIKFIWYRVKGLAKYWRFNYLSNFIIFILKDFKYKVIS